MLYLKILSIFLNFKTNVVLNLEPVNSDNKSISSFLIAESVSLSCSSGFQHYRYLHKLYKHVIALLFLHFFHPKNVTFFILWYKGLAESLGNPFNMYCILR